MSSLARVIEAHFISTWTRIGTAGGGALVEEPCFSITLGAIDRLPYNHILRCSPDGPVEPVIDEIVEVLDGREAVWSITSASGPPDLARRLEGMGAVLYSELTGMALELDGRSGIDGPEDLSIVQVGPDLLETWAALVLDQWHLSEVDRASMIAMHEEIGFETVRRWLCFMDGSPVAKVTSSLDENGVAGIYGMGTRPEARGRGIATTLMRHALRCLEEDGTRLVVLHATPMATGLYASLGFVEHCRFPAYALSAGTVPPGRLSRT